ncbi:MAG: hypothetical protein M3680_11870 [Myxococcota bacterium]|nr:hypothetical protein [Myxococcota bacterium]
MGNVHSVVQIAPIVSVEGAALRVRATQVDAFEQRYLASPRPAYVTMLRSAPSLHIANVNVLSSVVTDPAAAAVYLVLNGGGKWGYDDELQRYLRALGDLLEDARFFIHDEYVAFIDEYVLGRGQLSVERIVAEDGVIVDHVEEVLRAEPAKHYAFVMQQAADWLRLQEPDGALPWLDRAIASRPTSWEAHLARARALGAQAAHREAIASLDRACAGLGPYELRAWGDAADVLHRVVDDDAGTIASALQQIECVRGDQLLALDRFDEACAAWALSYSLTPRHANAAPMLHQGISLLARDRHDEAASCFTKAMRVAYDRGTIAAITYHRACLHARRGDAAAGLTELRLACELAADYRRRAREDEAFAGLADHAELAAILR